MKATELMIGDWMYCYGKSTKITILTNADIIATEIGDVVITPIPLTPEILEKNGWWFNTEDMWLHDEVDFDIEKWDGRFQCYDINQIKLDSVHELQHALRLCGLDELADNFKV